MIRVTEAIDFFKPKWYADWLLKVGKAKANRVSKKALKIGTRLHEIIASGTDTNSKDSKEVKNCFSAFIKWKERYFVTLWDLPVRLNDETIGLTGEPDFYWTNNQTLVDFKTSSRINPEHFFQLGGYARLLQVQTLGSLTPISHLAILRLDKETAEFEYKTNEMLNLSVNDCIDAFESTFKHYQYYNHIHKQLNGELI